MSVGGAGRAVSVGGGSVSVGGGDSVGAGGTGVSVACGGGGGGGGGADVAVGEAGCVAVAGGNAVAVAVGRCSTLNVYVMSPWINSWPGPCSSHAIKIRRGVLGAVKRIPTVVVWSGAMLSTGQVSGQPRAFSETNSNVVLSGQAHVPVLRRIRSKDGRPLTYQKS